MPVFSRRGAHPGRLGHYTKYRSLVREDFSACCAYCLLHETVAAGPEAFELDHFRPQSHPAFRHLADDFFNLYYACHVCNRAKGPAWPTEELSTAGYRFVDLCAEMFSDHFRQDQSGRWLPLTPAAAYTLERIRLNRRHLCELRRDLQELFALLGSKPIDWDVPIRDALLRLWSGLRPKAPNPSGGDAGS